MTPRIIYLIKRAEIEITSRMGKTLEVYGITPIQFTLLYFIDTAKGDFSSAQLSRQSMNELVQVLLRKKLLKKTVDQAHRRILRISLTAKGKQLLQDCNATLDRMEEALLKELTPAETNSIRNVIGKILDAARETVVSE
jgi:DNA-binding MarR family transcriptional regulator